MFYRMKAKYFAILVSVQLFGCQPRGLTIPDDPTSNCRHQQDCNAFEFEADEHGNTTVSAPIRPSDQAADDSSSPRIESEIDAKGAAIGDTPSAGDN